MSAHVDERRFQYERLALDWDAALPVAKKANKLFDRMHALSTEMKRTPEGRRALEGLLTHESRAVRLKTAAACLEWAPGLARPVLLDLVSPRGTHSLSAEMTLREYDAGRLKFDW